MIDVDQQINSVRPVWPPSGGPQEQHGLGNVRGGQALHEAQRRALVWGPHRQRRRRSWGARPGRTDH